jgi:hypothetical protein
METKPRLYHKEGTTSIGKSLTVQQIGMVLTQEEPVQQPVVVSSSVREVLLLYGLALLWAMC